MKKATNHWEFRKTAQQNLNSCQNKNIFKHLWNIDYEEADLTSSDGEFHILTDITDKTTYISSPIESLRISQGALTLWSQE